MSTRAHGADTVLVLAQGDADLHVAPQLEQALVLAASSSATRVVADLTEVTLFDSSAIHALLRGRSHAEGCDTQLTIVCANPSILKVLEIAGVSRLVPVYSTFTQATDGLPPAA